ncbi:hypothetical protein BJ742DRAFT_127928 [Cladochytrium replicatum]|nr:hypothetical protein BJ742DRAFT_127928 [Cladochytrium replicatum]
MGKNWEAPAEVWAQWQGVTTGFYLLNGGVYGLIYSWPTFTFLNLPFLFKPFSIPAIAATFLGIFIMALEWPFPALKGLNQFLKFWPKAIIYLLLAVLMFLQLTTVVPAQFLVITAITNMVASFQKEPPALQQNFK